VGNAGVGGDSGMSVDVKRLYLFSGKLDQIVNLSFGLDDNRLQGR